jgi:hypothetical protein
LPLFLNAKMRMALTKLQANMELGTSYAGLYALNEGLHALNYLSDEDYQFFKKRYSKKLVDNEEQSRADESNKQAAKEMQSMNSYFSMVLDQWHLHPNSEWRSKQLKKAQEYANRIPNAKLVLTLNKTSSNQ